MILLPALYKKQFYTSGIILPIMKKILVTIFSCSLFFCNNLSAQSADEKEAAYTKTINERSAKIVADLNVKDSSSFYTVRDIIANQYRSLRNIYDPKNEQATKLKSSITDKQALADSLKKLDEVINEKLAALHKKYLSDLSATLTNEQIEKVKNGMTYNVLNVTYTAYLDMIPQLTDEQKKQIMQWLTEARENAMDAESSDKKHAWFGKYKGRINNYLSAAGIDMKKEEAEWQKRIKEHNDAKKKVS
jgi:hypothetical protein